MKLILDAFYFDPALTPIPPVRVIRSSKVCLHTPQPDGYMEWHDWAKQASKTHSQVRCPHCGLWQIWLPKGEAQKIRRRDEAEANAFCRAMEESRKAGAV